MNLNLISRETIVVNSLFLKITTKGIWETQVTPVDSGCQVIIRDS